MAPRLGGDTIANPDAVVVALPWRHTGSKHYTFRPIGSRRRHAFKQRIHDWACDSGQHWHRGDCAVVRLAREVIDAGYAAWLAGEWEMAVFLILGEPKATEVIEELREQIAMF